MSMVHDDVATARPAAGRPLVPAPLHHGGGPAPCAARPGSQLVHPDGRCECFFGGAPPEFGNDSAPSGLLP